jgi:hypothetical protein
MNDLQFLNFPRLVAAYARAGYLQVRTNLHDVPRASSNLINPSVGQWLHHYHW